MKFSGTYDRNLDAKGRLSLPATLRKQLPDRVFVLPAPDADALYVFTEDAFGDWVDSVFRARGGYDPTKQEHILVRRALYAAANTLEIDSAARISLPEDARTQKHLKREVTVVGNEDRLEVWDRETYRTFSQGTADILANFFAN